MGIKRDIEELRSCSVIDEETAARIREYYATKKSYLNVTTLLCILAAFFIGMGVISIISYNWDNLPIVVRSILSLVPLGVSSYGSYYVLKHKSGIASWTESIAILQALSFTASYALVCQTFQIQSDTNTFEYICLIASLPFMFIFRSAGLSLIVILATCFEAGYNMDHYLSVVLLVANALFVYFYYIKGRESLLFRLRVALLPFTIVAIIVWYFGRSEIGVLMSVLGSAYYSLHMLVKSSSYPSKGVVLEIVSYLMIISSLLYYSANGMECSDFERERIVVAIVIALVHAVWIVFKIKKRLEVKWQELVGVVTFGALMTGNSIVISVLTLLVSGYAIYDSVKRCDVKELNVGILALFLWAMFVLNTYDLAFFFNGIIFIMLGVVLILMNIYMKKRCKIENKVENE